MKPVLKGSCALLVKERWIILQSKERLIDIDYHGWITLEQDRHPNDTN